MHKNNLPVPVVVTLIISLAIHTNKASAETNKASSAATLDSSMTPTPQPLFLPSAVCQPVAVPVATSEYFEYHPYYVTLHRCLGGDDNPKHKKCVAMTTKKVVIGVRLGYHPTKYVTTDVVNDTSCAMECALQQTECNQFQYFDQSSCVCKCKINQTPSQFPSQSPCPHTHVWSANRCECVCPSNHKDCKPLTPGPTPTSTSNGQSTPSRSSSSVVTTGHSRMTQPTVTSSVTLWSHWTACNITTCGGNGWQHRSRSCPGSACNGPLNEARACRMMCMSRAELSDDSQMNIILAILIPFIIAIFVIIVVFTVCWRRRNRLHLPKTPHNIDVPELGIDLDLSVAKPPVPRPKPSQTMQPHKPSQTVQPQKPSQTVQPHNPPQTVQASSVPYRWTTGQLDGQLNRAYVHDIHTDQSSKRGIGYNS